MGYVASAGDLDDMGTMSEAIQASRSEQGLAKQIRPLLRGLVASEQDSAAFIPLVDDTVEGLQGLMWEWLEPEVVESQHVGAQGGLETPLGRPSAISLCRLTVDLQSPRHGPVALAFSQMSQHLSNVHGLLPLSRHVASILVVQRTGSMPALDEPHHRYGPPWAKTNGPLRAKTGGPVWVKTTGPSWVKTHGPVSSER